MLTNEEGESWEERRIQLLDSSDSFLFPRKEKETKQRIFSAEFENSKELKQLESSRPTSDSESFISIRRFGTRLDWL